MGVIDGVVRQHQQTAYSILKNTLQQEWDFIQNVTPDIGEAFCPVNEDFQHYFLPVLFWGDTYEVRD